MKRAMLVSMLCNNHSDNMAWSSLRSGLSFDIRSNDVHAFFRSFNLPSFYTGREYLS